ncbi:hypothetical protein NXS19_013979 [Fusarium pseudograminearum]|nr:hypothetical protein NXS19_013979 [Fusarium pseudograminearum]
MATIGTNRPGGYDHHHHQNPLQNDDEFSLRHMMDAEPNSPDNSRDILSGSSSIPATGDGKGNGTVEITATQKMVSAMSGSLLTSLLVTPLDVVRVRLQSQAPRSTVDFSKLAITTSSLSRPNCRTRHHIMLSRSFLLRRQHRILPRSAQDRRHHFCVSGPC